MICILKRDEKMEIKGWIIAQNIAEACQKAQDAFIPELTKELETFPESKPGKYHLNTPNYLMLVV